MLALVAIGLLSASGGTPSEREAELVWCAETLEVRTAGEVLATIRPDARLVRKFLIGTVGFKPAQIEDPVRDLRRAFVALRLVQQATILLLYELDGQPARTRVEIAALLGSRHGTIVHDWERAGLQFLEGVRAAWPLPEETDPRLAASIHDLDVSYKYPSPLVRAGIFTVGMLTRKKARELEEIKNFSGQGVRDVGAALEKLGLSLAAPDPAPAAAADMGDELHAIADTPRARRLLLPVERLRLSARARRMADALGVRTLGDFARVSAEELLELRNAGTVSLVEIREKLAVVNIRLRGE